MFNFIAAFIANPDDKLPIPLVPGGTDKYFEEDVASNVPKMFRVLGCCYLIISIIGLLLITDNKIKEEKESLNYTLIQCFKTIQFYQIFFATLLSGTAGIFAIASYKTIGFRLSIHDSFLTLTGSVGSLFNGTMRIF